MTRQMPLNINYSPYTNFLGQVVGCTSAPTLTADCNGIIYRYEGSSNITITIPASLPRGFNVGFLMFGTGTITLSPGSGATNRSGKTAISTQYQAGSLLVARNTTGSAAEYLVSGDFV